MNLLPDEKLELNPPPPKLKPSPSTVVLGRFQPLHRGHIALIEWAYENKSTERIRIAIGSSNRLASPENPWSWEERKEMIETWKQNSHPEWELEIVAIPDINDPPKWVDHASKYHGDSGILITSDKETKALYESKNWEIQFFKLQNRGSFEGWRVRETCKMLSTVNEIDSVKEILNLSIHESVVEWLIDKDHLTRLPFLGPPVENVG
ncbi:MAG: hypothetical protein CMB64_06630 [Euryarchaeota archaeon]|nr:hypothetical protein [Euryarchaeota archaeon]|tara:strand:+ start:1618 stop:2238 length:621 start_codon:yes stop_codon:yes gene_type:complete